MCYYILVMSNFKTSFEIAAPAAPVLKIESLEELRQVLGTTAGLENYVIVGGGTNLVLNDKKEHKVAVISIKGMEIVEQTTSPDLSLQRRGDGDEEFVILKVAAGEVWDEVVQFAVENNLQGIEALSAIPGSAGAAPVQNIGAYGTEIKDVLEKVEAVERATGEAKEFTNSECEFTYRNSIFKNKLKDKFIITHIYLKLKKSKYAKLPEYKDVKEYFKDSGKESASLTEIRRAITEIRWCKLPRPEDLGNVGSFFHNPTIFWSN